MTDTTPTWRPIVHPNEEWLDGITLDGEVRGAGDELIAYCPSEHADLIAAAPEMKAALEATAAWFEKHAELARKPGGFYRAQKRVRAALAEAETFKPGAGDYRWKAPAEKDPER